MKAKEIFKKENDKRESLVYFKIRIKMCLEIKVRTSLPDRVMAPSHKARFLCAASDTGYENICQTGYQTCVISESSLAKTKRCCQVEDQTNTGVEEGCAGDYLRGWELRVGQRSFLLGVRRV